MYYNVCYFNLLESCFRSFDIEIDILTLKVKLNHQINTRNGSFCGLGKVGYLFLDEKFVLHLILRELKIKIDF